MRYKQDLPPKGGYPGINWQRNLPKRGYSGVTLFVAATGIISGGFVLLIRHIRRQRFEKHLSVEKMLSATLLNQIFILLCVMCVECRMLST